MPIYDTPAGLTALDTRALPSPEPDEERANGNGRIFTTAREAAQHGTLDDVAEAIVREAVAVAGQTDTLLARRARLDRLRARSRAAMAERGGYWHEVNFTPQPYVITPSSPAPGRCAGQPKHIYGLVDPYTGQLRYIGQSVDISRRLRDHVGENRSTCLRKTEWIEDLTPTGYAPVLWFLDSVLPRRADLWEVLYIQAAWHFRQPLCNDFVRECWTCAGDDEDWALVQHARSRAIQRLACGPLRALTGRGMIEV